MNSTLLKMDVKTNYKIWLLFLAIMLLYVTMIVSIYDPNNIDAFAAMLSMFPPELMDALNFSISDPSLVGFISGYLYGFIMIIFPMIYVIIVGNRMIAKYVDSGSMAYLLSTPNPRKKIALTQAVFLFTSVTLLIITISVIGFGITAIFFPGILDIQKYVIINLGLIGYYALISSISFFASCLFNETRYSLSIGAGIPIAFFVINMLSGASPDLRFFKYFTALSFYDSNQWLEMGNIVWIGMLVFLSGAMILYTIGIRIFMKKDLPL